MRESNHHEKPEEMEINSRLMWNLREVGHHLRMTSDSKGGQKRILLMLSQQESISQRELTHRLGLRPGSVSEVLGKLEEAGLISRTVNGEDHRQMDISITDAGRAMVPDARQANRDHQEKLFACFDSTEKQQLLELLEKLNQHWKENNQGERFHGAHPFGHRHRGGAQ